MTETLDQSDGIGGRHASARAMAERALVAQAAGDEDEADRLFAEAARIDPAAVENVLAEPPSRSATTTAVGSDEEVAAISSMKDLPDRAPSRSGITGPGSGADGQGT